MEKLTLTDEFLDPKTGYAKDALHLADAEDFGKLSHTKNRTVLDCSRYIVSITFGSDVIATSETVTIRYNSLNYQ